MLTEGIKGPEVSLNLFFFSVFSELFRSSSCLFIYSAFYLVILPSSSSLWCVHLWWNEDCLSVLPLRTLLSWCAGVVLLQSLRGCAFFQETAPNTLPSLTLPVSILFPYTPIVTLRLFFFQFHMKGMTSVSEDSVKTHLSLLGLVNVFRYQR